MKNKLHKNNISGHAELGSASHSVCHSVGILINKTPTFLIPKFSNILFLLSSLFFLLKCPNLQLAVGNEWWRKFRWDR